MSPQNQKKLVDCGYLSRFDTADTEMQPVVSKATYNYGEEMRVHEKKVMTINPTLNILAKFIVGYIASQTSGNNAWRDDKDHRAFIVAGVEDILKVNTTP